MKLRNARRLKARRYLFREYRAGRNQPQYKMPAATIASAWHYRRDPTLFRVIGQLRRLGMLV